jgi:uncharacterized membrane protein YagU involved in acid resistance
MATASAHSLSASITSRVVYGIIGGLAGGVVFGLLMQFAGMMGMVAQLVGSQSVVVGWLVHLFNSALFGAIFALLFAKWAGGVGRAAVLGLLYGVLWWVLGALLIMPVWLGMTEMVFKLGPDAWKSLAGHLAYGLVLGVVFALSARARGPR